MLDTESFLLGIATGGGGDGGNPNYVETITGTLANPWGDKIPDELVQLYKLNNVSLFLGVRADKLSLLSGDDGILFGLVAGDMEDYVQASLVMYNEVGDFVEQKSFHFTTPDQYEELSSETPCTLTIIHHPMP